MIELENLLCRIREAVRKHRVGEGRYALFATPAQGGESDGRRDKPYGCADAANIQYTLGDFPADPAEREAAVRALQDFQDPETGLFHDVATPGYPFYCHHPFHTTAHCTAALELFDARPRYRLKALEPYLDFRRMADLLDGLNWTGNPWPESHQGAGIYSALVITGMAGRGWRREFFEYLTRNADPEYGMSRAGAIQTGKAKLSHHLNGWFHYLFCFNHDNAPFPYPEKLIDTCLDLCRNRPAGDLFGRSTGFQEIDWVFPLNRASRQTPHRHEEIKAALRDFAVSYIAFLYSLAESDSAAFNELHSLFGTVCCLSELYLALPGEIAVEKPLKNVLDRRPFI